MSKEAIGKFLDEYIPESTTISAIIVAGASTVMIGEMPLFADMFVKYFQISAGNAGWTLSVEFMGVGLGAALAFFMLPRVRWPRLALAAALLSLAANMASPAASGIAMLMMLRGLSGLGAGLLYSTAIGAVSNARQLGRAFGGVVLAQSVFPVIYAAGLTWTASRVGLAAAIASMALWFALCAALSFALRGTVSHRASNPAVDEAHRGGNRTELSAILSLIALMLFMTSVFAYWSYATRLGIERGFDPVMVANSIPLGLIGGGVCAVVAMVCGDRPGRLRMAALACAMLLAGAIAAAQAGSIAVFEGGLTLFCGGWSLGVAYFMSMTAFYGQEATIARFIPGAQILSSFLGPAIAAGLIGDGSSVAAAAIAAEVLAFAALLLCGLVAVTSASFAPRPHPEEAVERTEIQA